MLLILTSNQDFAADYLILKLIEKGLPYFRLNSEDLHFTQALHALDANGMRSEIGVDAGKSLDLGSVTSVWYRRSVQPAPDCELQPAERVFLAGEMRHFWNGLSLGADAVWVNPPHYVHLAEHKLFQLKKAMELRFEIPKTIVSNSIHELRAFVDEVGEAICKPIYHGRFVDGEQIHAIYTRRVTLSHLGNEEDIGVCPVFLQQEIKRRADIRVTFIGEACFSVRITCQDKGIVDWRKPDAGASYRVEEIPDEILEKCKEMMAAWQLLYAAFDFIEDQDGNWIFLEINPTGEWAWLEDMLSLPMREAFIQLFYGG